MSRILSVVLALGVGVYARDPFSRDDIVDLGYAVHLGSYNRTGDYYSFTNIQYAEQPVGPRRFKPPVAVRTINRTVNDGTNIRHCPHVLPDWWTEKISKKTDKSFHELRNIIRKFENQGEDCLLLDVFTPRAAYVEGRLGAFVSNSLDGVSLDSIGLGGIGQDGGGQDGKDQDGGSQDGKDQDGQDQDGKDQDSGSRDGKAHSDFKGAPVMVRFPEVYFSYSGKEHPTHYGEGDLLARSREADTNGIVIVNFNTRVGIFGWLNAGDDPDIFPNVALQDQLMALQWVKRYIHLFGGDPDNITVIGAGGGAASIMHHITAKGGKAGKLPFKRAILQSPAFNTLVSSQAIWSKTLEVASRIVGRVDSGAGLAALDGLTLLKVNRKIIENAPRGSHLFAPTIDGRYVTDLPGSLLLEGKFDPSPTLMIGHTSNEWLDGYDPFEMEEPFVSDVKILKDKVNDALRGIPRETVNTIWGKIYPPPGANTTPYTSLMDRYKLLLSEFLVTCNTKYLSNAFGNRTWNYRFQVPPGFHEIDSAYTYFNGEFQSNFTKVKTDCRLAEDFQRYLTNFVQFGNPNIEGMHKWPDPSEEESLATFGHEGIKAAKYEAYNDRCAYFQTANYRIGFS